MQGEVFIVAKKYRWLVRLVRARAYIFQSIKKAWDNSQDLDGSELTHRTFQNMLKILREAGIIISANRRSGNRYECEILPVEEVEDPFFAEALRECVLEDDKAARLKRDKDTAWLRPMTSYRKSSPTARMSRCLVRHRSGRKS